VIGVLLAFWAGCLAGVVVMAFFAGARCGDDRLEALRLADELTRRGGSEPQAAEAARIAQSLRP